MASGSKPSLGCGYAVFAVVLLLAAAAFAGAVAEARTASGSAAGVGVLGVLGGGLLAAAFLYLRLARREVARHAERERIAAEHPGKPWLLRPEWRQGALEAREGRGAATLWFVAVFWNGISWTAAWAAFGDGPREKGAYVVLLFPLVGALLLWAAIHQTIRWRKFGRVRFVPSGLPGAIGGYLGGVIEVPRRLELQADARLALRCVRRVTRGSGKNRTTSETVLWESEELVARDQWMGTANRTDIPVLFYIPPECEPWNDDDPNNQVVWRLSASAAVPGVDFATSFEVPVFNTGETAAPPEPGRPLLAEYRAGLPDAAVLQSAGVEALVDGFRFNTAHLGTGRAVTTSIAAALLGSAAFLAVVGAPAGAVVVTGLFGIPTALLAVEFWADRVELRIAGPDVVVTHSRPWATSVVRLPRAEVAEVRVAPWMSAGEAQYFRLMLVGRPGVDPMTAPAGEHFHARKLRSRLQRLARELGAHDVTKLGGAGAEILEAMARTPRFEVSVAKFVPGRAVAEAVGRLVLERIRGERVSVAG